MKYRPCTPKILYDLLCHHKKEEVKKVYLGNLLWAISKFFHPDFSDDSYATFVEKLDQNPYHKEKSKEISDHIETMISIFLSPGGE